MSLRFDGLLELYHMLGALDILSIEPLTTQDATEPSLMKGQGLEVQ